MKRIIPMVCVGFVFALSPLSVSAQSLTNATEAQLRAKVAELEALVATLRAEIAALKANQSRISPTATGMPGIHINMQNRFNRSLRQGMSGDDVRALQEWLAKDPSLYPEGTVTGYFGPRTEAALKRLKMRHGIEDDGEPFGIKVRELIHRLMANTTPPLTPPGIMPRPSTSSDRNIEELLNQIRAGKRGDELRENRGSNGADGANGMRGTDGANAPMSIPDNSA